ncbi:MAG: prephenate dehydratase [Clostridia bacterium]|nr:prephenate dehydratase [Clostridia bacterium]
MEKDKNILLQGVAGSYSHIFAKSLGYTKIDFVKTFEEVVSRIESGEYKYGILPIENSTAGDVRETFDLLDNSKVCYINTGEIKINHCLLGAKGSKLSDIQKVSSHPQALMQCDKFLESGGYQIFNEFNTAIASKKLAEEGDKSHAVIASHLAGEIYGLEVLKENIQNVENNYTKFVLLTNSLEEVMENSIISVALELKDKPNALGELLNIFTEYHINLTRIQSRNIPNTCFKIRFYIDFEGNINEDNIKSLLSKVSTKCLALKVRGVY